MKSTRGEEQKWNWNQGKENSAVQWQALEQWSKLFYDACLVLFLFMSPSLSLFCVCPQCEHTSTQCLFLCACTVLWTACCSACMASTEATKQTVLWRASSAFPFHAPLYISIVCLPSAWARCLFFSLCCSVSWTLDALPERQAPKQRSKLFYDARLVLFLFMPPCPSLFHVCPQCQHSACFCVRAVFHELCSAMPEQHQAVAGVVPEWRLPPGHQHLHQQHEGQSCQG